jgi:hypothetical protein
MPYKADRRLWLDADKKKVVEEGDPDAAFLLAAPDQEIPDEVADQYDLKSLKGAEETKQLTPEENKSLRADAERGDAAAAAAVVEERARPARAVGNTARR